MIKCDHISLTLSEKNILTDLSFHLNKGEHTAISGASGKGKSSILKLLQGFLIPNSGRIQVNNIELTNSSVSEIRKQIIWIPQNVNLSISSGNELIQLLELEDQNEIISSNMEQLGLDKTIVNRDFKEISGGQKQRIVIGICFALKRNIILMDEPTSSLDTESIQLLIKLVHSLKDKTILSTSHNQLWLNSVNQVITL